MFTNVELATSGNIWKVLVKPGQAISMGETLFIMEVMKMEIPHDAPCDGIVREVNVKNDQEGLDAGMIAIVIESN